ncbi:hypothetical protein TOT_030000006 [Theileria orientalis strain Shintoku]|uniref:Uncharacterized protein n=1 Tax=Theileria orientalis strain Shintoku TaxID=869250 RepID=J4DPI1_THEOR|nr:hypothetical protein TOT_030000006 [Theileria orientalis strain Shintoku]BAM40744.1 hypothetical protein TOT_030000006 [Theileria orientalis strain Shintoku]|eukprot:XP_009691045.1 hypothetical protein TOT_030000006 [Theileria orientalis strain Shintoku]
MSSTHKASILNRPVTPKNGCGYTSTRRQHINHVTEQPEWIHLNKASTYQPCYTYQRM